MVREEDQHDDRPEMVEVIVRATRWMAHAADEDFPIETSEPFDLAREVAELRSAVLPHTGEATTGARSLFVLLHGEPVKEGPFDAAIWKETMALGRSEPTPATNNLKAQAYALKSVLLHVLDKKQLRTVAALAGSGMLRNRVDVDLELVTLADRKLQAKTIAASETSIFYDEYFRP